MKPSNKKQTPEKTAAEIRSALKDGGSAQRAKGMQWFFKDAIKAYGWRTADLRRVAKSIRREIREESGLHFLLALADRLFSGSVLEEKIIAVFLLENLDSEFGDREFLLFESWLERISSWADHDALVHDLIAPMVIAKPARAKTVFRWAKSPDRWHRRAACVALIRASRRKMFFDDITKLSDFLLNDKDDMVQKGLGWLLRETAKYNAKKTAPYLMTIRGRTPRLVLRTACETLPNQIKKRILSQPVHLSPAQHRIAR
jgi:3-methyladenine DNA glycosylase AlkD